MTYAELQAWIVATGGGRLPPKPSRGEVCQIRSAMQGLMVTLPSYGTLPYFPPLLGWLRLQSDRLSLYGQLRAANVSHVIICVSGQYSEPGTPYEAIPGRDFSQDWPALKALCQEAIQQGFCVLLKMAGDGQSVPGPPWSYNDPVGWTYGYQWLMAQLSTITTLLADLEPWILYSPGFDGVFGPVPGSWSPDQLADYLLTLRAMRPECYSDLQFAIPYISDGDGGGFYQSPQGQALDSGSCEWDYPALAPGDPINRFCQNSARLLGPAFVCLYGCQPGPFYLQGGTPRGPFFANSFETATYWFIHGQASVADCLANQATFASVGWLDCMPYPHRMPR